jgi:hypothetical protein
MTVNPLLYFNAVSYNSSLKSVRFVKIVSVKVKIYRKVINLFFLIKPTKPTAISVEQDKGKEKNNTSKLESIVTAV